MIMMIEIHRTREKCQISSDNPIGQNKWSPAKHKNLVPPANSATKLTQAFNPHFYWCCICIPWSGEDTTLSTRSCSNQLLHIIRGDDNRTTYWYSATSVSKSTLSTPTSSRLSSTIEARSWSVASSIPKKRAGPDFGTAGI